MAVVVDIDAIMLEDWGRKLSGGIGIEAQKQVTLALTRAAAIVAHNEASEMPRDTGNAAKNVSTILTPFSATIRPKDSYMQYVYTGTKPHMPPVNTLAPWAERHGMNPWALAKSIAKKGTKANKFVDRAWQKSQPEVLLEFESCASYIAKFSTAL